MNEPSYGVSPDNVISHFSSAVIGHGAAVNVPTTPHTTEATCGASQRMSRNARNPPATTKTR